MPFVHRTPDPATNHDVALRVVSVAFAMQRRALTRRRIAMASTPADVLIETIHDWGVEVVFGLPGDGINGIMESLRTHQEQIRFIQVRHEEAAAFMACAYAKFTGK